MKTLLNNISNLQSETTVVQTINDNNDRIEQAFENTLSRDGTTPNQMEAPLDMNGERILNLPPPIDPGDPVRLYELDQVSLGLSAETVQELLDAVPEIEADRIAAEVARDEAEQAAQDAQSYIGAATSAPRWSTPRTLTISGSVTGVSGLIDGTADFNVVTTLANGVVTNAKMAGGAALANLGYTPLNKAGDTALGDLKLTVDQPVTDVWSVGLRGLPVKNINTDYTITSSDAGKLVRHTSATPHSVTLPKNSTLALPIGTTIPVRNVGAGNLTVTREDAAITVRTAGQSSHSDKVIAQWGLVTFIKEDTDSWVASGVGIT